MARRGENVTLLSAADRRPGDELLPPEIDSGSTTITGTRLARVLGGRAEDPQGANGPVPSLETDRFIARGVLGIGGSSVVIRAFDRDVLRDVAIKILATESTEGDLVVSRFTEEARITGQLEHPNIVPVYEYGLDRRGQRFLCMKLVEGVTLANALERLGAARLDPEHLAELLQVFVKVCDAISFAHSRSVIHRDLKPTNIMLSEFGQVYVVDWGVARRLRKPSDPQNSQELDPPGAVIGTTCYMAPEQVQGLHDTLDVRTDVFALGATLYQILTGRPPLTPEIVHAVWLRRPPEPVTPPEQLGPAGRIPTELARIAMRAISYDPADRYASVLDLKRDIEVFLRGSWDLPRLSLPAGATIVGEGEPGNEAYVILEGRCVAYRGEGEEEVELRVMGPGEVFGEMAVFSAKPRSASIRAVTDVVLLVVTSKVLSNAVGLNSWMGAFVKVLAERFREVEDRLRAYEGPPKSSIRPRTGG
jgi:tRNA A-37 threonylcarbamoyl transferase component Bud32